VHALQRLLPDLRMEDLHPAGAGVRAQAIDPGGALVDDFSIQVLGGVVHVLNAPSPPRRLRCRSGGRSPTRRGVTGQN
jgi:hypothetical protein